MAFIAPYVTADILTNVLQKCFLSSPLPNISFLSKPLNLIGCHGNWKAKIAKKYYKIISLEAIRGIKLKLCRNVHNISLYKNGIFSSPEPLGSWWVYSTGWHLLSICMCVCMSTFSNISSENTGPIEANFHVEPPWDGEMKVCSNDPGHMTKMAAMPIYVKNMKNSSSLEPKGQWPWKLKCSIGYLSTSKFVLGWPWPILWRGQILSLMLLYGKIVKGWIFQNLL